MKTYILVDAQLSWPQRLVQASHAAAGLAFMYRDGGITLWHDAYKTLAVLAVRNSVGLLEWDHWLEAHGVRHFSVCEPDLGDRMTAIAVHPCMCSLAEKRLAKLNLLE